MADTVRLFTVYLAIHPLAGRTRLEYRRDVKALIAYLHDTCGITTPAQVATEHLTAYVHSLSQRGYVAATQRRQVAAIRSFFTFLLTYRYISHDLAAQLRPPDRSPTALRILTELQCHQIERLCAAVPRDAALIAVLVHTGMRISEAAHLRVADIDLPPGSDRSGTGVTHIAGRAHRARTVTLNATTCQKLHDYLHERPTAPTDALFLSHRQHPLTVRGMRLVVKRYLDAAGVGWATLRTLRHSFAVRQIGRGTKLEALRQMLGHASTATVDPYRGVVAADTRPLSPHDI